VVRTRQRAHLADPNEDREEEKLDIPLPIHGPRFSSEIVPHFLPDVPHLSAFRFIRVRNTKGNPFEEAFLADNLLGPKVSMLLSKVHLFAVAGTPEGILSR